MVANGHDAGAVINYSPDKLRLFFELAQARVAKENARSDLSLLRLERLAAASLMDKKALRPYNMTEASLERIISGKVHGAPEQPNLEQLANRLRAMGAKQSYGRIN